MLFSSKFQFLAAEAVEVKSVFNDLQDVLSSHQGEMAHLARELRQVCMFALDNPLRSPSSL